VANAGFIITAAVITTAMFVIPRLVLMVQQQASSIDL